MDTINIIKAHDTVKEKFINEKWHCAESVLFSILVASGHKNPENLITPMSGFSGGIGGTRNLCGALSGGIAAIGCILGRYGSHAQNHEICSATSKKLYKLFEDRYNTTSCSMLTKDYDFSTPARREYCGSLVEFTVSNCCRIINEAIKGIPNK